MRTGSGDKVTTRVPVGPLIIAQKRGSVSKGQGLCEPFSERGPLREHATAGNQGRKGVTRPKKQGPRARNISRQVHLSILQPRQELCGGALRQPQIKGKTKFS